MILTVGALKPGVPAESVEPTAAQALREVAVVEATSIDIVAGEARLTLRFTADNVRDALRVADHTVAAVRRCAAIPAWRVTERVGGRWFRRA